VFFQDGESAEVDIPPDFHGRKPGIGLPVPDPIADELRSEVKELRQVRDSPGIKFGRHNCDSESGAVVDNKNPVTIIDAAANRLPGNHADAVFLGFPAVLFRVNQLELVEAAQEDQEDRSNEAVENTTPVIKAYVVREGHSAVEDLLEKTNIGISPAAAV
jgi:hypothetical protein